MAITVGVPNLTGVVGSVTHLRKLRLNAPSIFGDADLFFFLTDANRLYYSTNVLSVPPVELAVGSVGAFFDTAQLGSLEVYTAKDNDTNNNTYPVAIIGGWATEEGLGNDPEARAFILVVKVIGTPNTVSFNAVWPEDFNTYYQSYAPTPIEAFGHKGGGVEYVAFSPLAGSFIGDFAALGEAPTSMAPFAWGAMGVQVKSPALNILNIPVSFAGVATQGLLPASAYSGSGSILSVPSVAVVKDFGSGDSFSFRLVSLQLIGPAALGVERELRVLDLLEGGSSSPYRLPINDDLEGSWPIPGPVTGADKAWLASSTEAPTHVACGWGMAGDASIGAGPWSSYFGAPSIALAFDSGLVRIVGDGASSTMLTNPDGGTQIDALCSAIQGSYYDPVCKAGRETVPLYHKALLAVMGRRVFRATMGTAFSEVYQAASYSPSPIDQSVLYYAPEAFRGELPVGDAFYWVRSYSDAGKVKFDVAISTDEGDSWSVTTLNTSAVANGINPETYTTLQGGNGKSTWILLDNQGIRVGHFLKDSADTLLTVTSSLTDGGGGSWSISSSLQSLGGGYFVDPKVVVATQGLAELDPIISDALGQTLFTIPLGSWSMGNQGTTPHPDSDSTLDGYLTAIEWLRTPSPGGNLSFDFLARMPYLWSGNPLGAPSQQAYLSVVNKEDTLAAMCFGVGGYSSPTLVSLVETLEVRGDATHSPYKVAFSIDDQDRGLVAFIRGPAGRVQHVWTWLAESRGDAFGLGMLGYVNPLVISQLEVSVNDVYVAHTGNSVLATSVTYVISDSGDIYTMAALDCTLTLASSHFNGKVNVRLAKSGNLWVATYDHYAATVFSHTCIEYSLDFLTWEPVVGPADTPPAGLQSKCSDIVSVSFAGNREMTIPETTTNLSSIFSNQLP